MQFVQKPLKLLKHYSIIILGQSRERDRKIFSKRVPLKSFTLAFGPGPLYCRIARTPVRLSVRPYVAKWCFKTSRVTSRGFEAHHCHYKPKTNSQLSCPSQSRLSAVVHSMKMENGGNTVPRQEMNLSKNSSTKCLTSEASAANWRNLQTRDIFCTKKRFQSNSFAVLVAKLELPS